MSDISKQVSLSELNELERKLKFSYEQKAKEIQELKELVKNTKKTGPARILVIITTKCSYRTRCNNFCLLSSPKDQRNMSFETFTKVIDSYPDTTSWGLSGGEPTDHPEILKFCEYLKDKDVTIQTIMPKLDKLDSFLAMPNIKFELNHFAMEQNYLNQLLSNPRFFIDSNKPHITLEKLLAFRYFNALLDQEDKDKHDLYIDVDGKEVNLVNYILTTHEK
jgi:organic radical activating enzyme